MMRLPLAFRVVLLLYLLSLLLSVDGSSRKKNKKQGRSKSSAAGSKSRSSKIGRVFLGPTLNISTIASPSPSRSLSPWTYVTSYNDSRIPMQISEAKCEKRGCVLQNGEEDLGLESRPIQYQIQVLRRMKGKNKRYILKLESKIISVGCTCVQPTVVPQE